MADELHPVTGGGIRVSGIVKESVVDGPGIRLVVFAQGCERACPGCHNPETQPLDGGYYISCREILEMAQQNPLLRGLTLSGGEPFLQARAFALLAKSARAKGLDIVTYTGYTIEELLATADNSADSGNFFYELLTNTDILIDGPFIESKRSLNLKYCGSSNQRVIDVRKYLRPREKQNENLGHISY